MTQPDHHADVTIRGAGVALPGTLDVPAEAAGIVLFAHGSGSSRFSPRNRHVADVLHAAGLGTLLFDLLTPEEDLERAHVFDVERLTERLVLAIDWVRQAPPTRGRPIGLFGASTGAAAALVAAAERPSVVRAVVSRGGRPDLAAERLAEVRAPTLLLVGGLDETVLALNRRAYRALRCERELRIIPGATHLFEEPGTLDLVAEGAAQWLGAHLGGGKSGRREGGKEPIPRLLTAQPDG